RVAITGRETELDRTVVDVLSDPLVHLVRNSLDHGLETPEERIAAGKDPTGTLDISATTEGGNVIIRVRDDGRGMNPQMIRDRAVARGVVTAEAGRVLSDEAAFDLCFAPGFSTRAEANDISGRGVGLDVVRSSVRALGGDVLVESSDAGTIMTVQLPLTLAIRSVLLVRVDGDMYAFHIDRVGTTFDLDLQPIRDVAGKPSLLHHGEVLPLIDLGEQLIEMHFDGDDWRARGRNFVVTIETTSGPIGVVVDEVIGQSEVVTRALPATVRASDLIASSSVLGDGEVAFLIDTTKLTDRVLPEGIRNVFA
ncbi:MAG: chemotaxis protein CheW, partial [Thermoleophilia bacterium]|nr:chemotaxis protein CheW [Thermoleophilia bacterium]